MKAGLTFASGLRSIVRSDPDVIMVGEIRDRETAQIAIESALTGHLVLSTLHTNDAPTAITRLTEMGIEPFLTASAVDCVVSQRLARMLCTQLQGAASRSAPSARRSQLGVARTTSRPTRRAAASAAAYTRLQGPGRPLRGDARDRRDPRARDRARLGRRDPRRWRSSRACARSQQDGLDKVRRASPRSRKSQE